MNLNWNDIEDIAILLQEKEPQLDPLTVRFTDLRDKVLALPDFKETAAELNEKKLEAIQMAWYQEYQESQ